MTDKAHTAAVEAAQNLARWAGMVLICLALSGCELLFQYQFTKAWAEQGEKP